MGWDFIIAGDGPRPFKCPGCQKEFEWAIQLQQHWISVHLRPAPPPTPTPTPPPTPTPTPSPTPRQPSSRQIFRCAHCPAVYLSKFGLNVHLVLQRRQPTDIPLSTLSQELPCQERHVEVVHLDAHKCPFPGCRHSSATETLLKVHLKTHSKKKGFVCGRCPKTYKHLTSLRKHVRNVHRGHEEDDEDEVQISEDYFRRHPRRTSKSC